MEQRYVGKSALVTGAGSGIGRAVAQRLAAEGARVACVDVVADNVAATVDGHRRRRRLRLHLRRQRLVGSVEATVADATEAFGQIDVLCNVAGIGGFANSHDVDPGQFTTHGRGQPQRHVLHVPGRAAPDGRAGRGRHRQHRLDRRHHGPALERRVLRLEGRRADAHQGAGHRVRHPDPRQRGRPRRRRHQHVHRVHPARGRRLGPDAEDVARQRRSRVARRRWPACTPTSAPTRPATSPARSW